MNRASLLAIAASAAAAFPALGQQTLYAIGDGGASLIRFDAADPSAVTVVGTFGGGASFLDALDFRPATGQLYGYLDSADSFYTVDLATAELTLASSPPSGAPTNTFQLGMDFNPRVDRARVITDSDQNVVFNPFTGGVTAATSVFFAGGDVNEGADPNIIDNAYTQSFAGAAATQQYAIDYGLDILVTVANDSGVLETVGALGVDTDIYSGFDIFTSPGGVDIGYAILTPAGGAPTLYTIDLATGAATPAGDLGFTNQVYSLAAVPAPAPLALLGLAGLRARRPRR